MITLYFFWFSLTLFALFIGSFVLFLVKSVDDPEGYSFADARNAIDNKSFDKIKAILKRQLHREPSDVEARFHLERVVAWQDKWLSCQEDENIFQLEQLEAEFLVTHANTLKWVLTKNEALHRRQCDSLLFNKVVISL